MTLVATALAISVAAGVAGCQVQPLYAPEVTVGGQQGGVNEALRSVRFGGVGGTLGNELTFGLYGGKDPLPARYFLNVIYTEQSTDLGVQQFSNVPAENIVRGLATFTLTDLKTNEPILQGTSFASASYDIGSQSFSNLRAQRDAASREQKAIAQDIRTRVAAALAGHKE